METESVIQEYDAGDSIHVIAKRYDTYPNKIRRILIKAGRPLRDRAEAQRTALETGRSSHPTKGRKRTEQEKINISDAVHKSWTKISKKERQKRVDGAKERWYNMSEAERKNLQSSAIEGMQRAARDGSSIEIYIRDELEKTYEVSYHKTHLLEAEDLEIDILLPSLSTVIEIDGPSHFLPIWGEEALEKHIQADAKKNGLLLSNEFVVIRVKCLKKNISNKIKRDIYQKIKEELEAIEENFPPKGDRYIELEIK